MYSIMINGVALEVGNQLYAMYMLICV